VRDQRENLMGQVRKQLSEEAKSFGIEVVDVRIRRADLPEQNSQAVFRRMQTERQQRPLSSAPRAHRRGRRLKPAPTAM